MSSPSPSVPSQKVGRLATVLDDPGLARQDLGDLLPFMVLTGCRTGEAAGLRWDRVELTSAKVTFDQVVEILGRCPRSAEVVFATTLVKLRDRSDAEGPRRRERDRLGYPGLKSHGFRKTCATALGAAGLSARAIAEYLGHAKPSMTQTTT